jgi:hypothetical protein
MLRVKCLQLEPRLYSTQTWNQIDILFVASNHLRLCPAFMDHTALNEVQKQPQHQKSGCQHSLVTLTQVYAPFKAMAGKISI